MAELICVNTGEVSSALLKQSISGAETSLSGLKSMSKGMSGLRCERSTGNVALFTSGITSGVNDAVRALNVAQAKLEQYAALMDTGPSELIAVDQRYKNELTNWWERGSYSVQTWGESTLGYWVDNFEEKGWFYKTVKSGEMIGGTVISLIGVSAAWASVFLGKPENIGLALGKTVYLWNDSINMNDDLLRLWTGKFDEIESTNWLEDGLSSGFGTLFDSEEAGEIIGETVYDLGKIYILFGDFRNLDEALSDISWKELMSEGPEAITYFKDILYGKPITEASETVFRLLDTDWGELVKSVYDAYDIVREAITLNQG